MRVYMYEQKPTIILEEPAISNMFQIEAVIRVLKKKGICAQ